MCALMTSAAQAATKFLKSIAPWYDWGTTNTVRIDAVERDFSDEAEGEVRFAELQWLGIHLGIQLGRTPSKTGPEAIAARKRAYAAAKISEEVAPAAPESPVAIHTRLMRSHVWRIAADAFHTANASSDTSDEAILDAGNAYMNMIETRVGALPDFREKLDLMAAADCALDPHDVRELMLDLDLLGARARRAVAA